MTNANNLQYYCPYNIHDNKYMSDGNRLKGPTVVIGIEPTLVQSSTHKIPETSARICKKVEGGEALKKDIFSLLIQLWRGGYHMQSCYCAGDDDR